MKAGEFKKFNFTGKKEEINLAPGSYILEVWGAAGAYNSGKGGYSRGILNLKTEEKLIVYVGGKNGFNGGGKVINAQEHCGGNIGGGATDIRFNDDLYSRIIVAGGGGSGFSISGYGVGGDGGGSYGYSGVSKKYSVEPPTGGTSSRGGHGSKKYSSIDSRLSGGFGYGGNGVNEGAGGGSGWYGGGGSNCANDCGGGGGSGYVLTSYSEKPSNYNPPKKFYMTNTYMENGINAGSGYCIITCISGGSSSNGASVFCKIDGVWKGVESVETKIDGKWQK